MVHLGHEEPMQTQDGKLKEARSMKVVSGRMETES